MIIVNDISHQINHVIILPLVFIPSKTKVNVKSKSYVLRYYNLNDTILPYKG